MPTPEGSNEGVPARRAALRILDAVLRRGQTMDNAAQAARGLPPADSALASAIAGETLRRLPDLDALIDGATRQRLPDDSKARTVLRMALAQKIGLGTPDHALVATALPLVDGGPRRLVHGVLGTLLRKGLPALHAPRLPADVEERWRAAWGEEVVLAARRAIAHRPLLDLSFADHAAESEFPEGVSLAPLHRRLDHHGAITMLPGFGEGRWWVQDLAASLPARLVPASAGRVLDACAAPGGKTMQLAAAGHRVTALDRSESRLARLRDNLARTNLHAETVTADAVDWSPGESFDAVLLDAPCSATGTIRRHPDVAWTKRPEDVTKLADLQRRLLDKAATLVRPGGRLVYCTCSLEPEEGEGQIEAFLARQPLFSRLAIESGEIGGLSEVLDARGDVRTLPCHLANLGPGRGGLDGFYVARLVRRADEPAPAH